MHSFIRTYPSSSAASAASSSQISRSTEEDENGSICCDIYIDGEEQQQTQKGGSKQSLQVAAVLRGISQAERPLPEPRKQRKCSCWVILVTFVAIIAAAVVIGVSVGVSQHKQHQPAVVLSGGGRNAQSSSVTITVPFGATTRIESTPGRILTCDSLFGDEQELEKFVDQLEAAHTRKMAQYQVDEVVVTELQCNNISYPVPAETFLAGKPGAGAADHAAAHPASRRRLAGQQEHKQQQRAVGEKLTSGVYHAGSTDGGYGSSDYLSGSSSSSLKPLVIYVELEAKHREQLDRVPTISSHVAWIQKVSKAGAALAGQLVPDILKLQFNLGHNSLTVTSVHQLNVEVLSSQIIYDDLVEAVASQHAGRKGYKGSTVVTRTVLDPFTGDVVESQTMRLPVLPDYLPELLPDFPTDKPSSTAVPTDTAPSSGSSSTEPTAEEPPTQGPACSGECRLPNTFESACVEGICQVVACAAGWEDCDGNPVNGCEANVLGFFSDDNHCGSCNKVCLAPLSCQLGKCSDGPPPPPITSEPEDTQEEEEQEEPDHQQQQQPEQQQQKPEQKPQKGGEGEQDKKEEEVKPVPTLPQPEHPKPQEPQQKPQQKPHDEDEEQEDEEPPAALPRPPVTPVEPPTPAPVKPSVPAVPKPPTPSTKPHPHPSKPPTPFKPRPPLVALRDDLARISPGQSELALDVISNDDLLHVDPAHVTLSVMQQPAVGTVTVLPAEGPAGRPRLLFKQGKDKLEPGSELEIYYTVAVPGHPTPSPATALLLGSAAPSDSSLINCSSSAAATVTGTPLRSLTRADDTAATVKLPFAVHMYGSSYSTATISSNGWVSLGDSGAKEPCNVEGSWPTASCLGTGPVLAPFWDDLIVDQVLTHHDTKLDAYVIQWTNVMSPASKLPIGTFQTWLFPNGTVGYVYRDLYGSEQALGSSAAVGVRGPTAKAAGHALQLKSKAFEKAGAGSDEHGSWLFSSALDDHSDYVTLMGIHRRFLSPGMAVISHPSGAAGVPGKFGPWTAAAGSSGSSVWPLLVSPDSPPRPLLLPLVTKTASPAQKAANKRVVTLTWEFPAHASHTPLSPTYYKLYLAADPHFNTLLRQPTAAAFKPDIPANSLSVDVELSGSHVALDVYALLLACNSAACSRSCIGHYAVQ